MRTLTVIINYNNYPDTKECVDSCISAYISIKDLIVVDNGSEKEIISNLKENLHKTEIMELSENRGYSGAINVGLKESLSRDYEYTLILNNDIVVNEDTIKELETVFQKDPKIGAVAPVNYFYDKEEICFSGGYFDPKTASNPHYNDLPDKDREVGFLTGAALMIRNSILHDVGFFDEEYFLYHEDSDFCHRILDCGYKLYVAAKASVKHKVSKTAHENQFIYYYCQRNLLLTFKKYGDKKYKKDFYIKFIRAILRLVKYSLQWPMKTRKFKMVYYSFWGIIDYYRGRFGKNEKI